MAGVFAANDALRGVWNAPANIASKLRRDQRVAVNAAEQGPLNVPINGKAVNVIREFTDRGAVVWGARTLDGNSLDYRYVQIRRTIIYIEQSIQTALDQYVFAPNNGQTWVAVTAMVSAFLQNLWSQGGLMSDKRHPDASLHGAVRPRQHDDDGAGRSRRLHGSCGSCAADGPSGGVHRADLQAAEDGRCCVQLRRAFGPQEHG